MLGRAIPTASILVLFALAGLLSTASAQERQSQDRRRIFRGNYDALSPVQRALVEDWYRRFSEVSGTNLDAQTAWRKVPLSVRTTFDAVTNALENNELTDEDGRSLGTALDLIERLDWVAGRVRGAGGDHQFRIYVTLTPDALEKLASSTQYSRGMDNTVFHKGYPISYREPGTPSSQFSISRNGRHADIDVDYRSSKFPLLLVDGHLTAANSDVRAGHNYRRHVRRWEGLFDWWDHLFGLSLETIEEGELRPVDLVPEPRVRHRQVQDAAHDFLKAWLVEGRTQEAMAYVSNRALSCVEPGQGEESDYGMAPFHILADMRHANDVLGKVTSLEDVVLGVHLTGEDLKVVDQEHHYLFVLFEVPEDLAIAFLCENRHLPDEVLPEVSSAYGKYFATSFYLKSDEHHGEPITLLWAREGGHWRIVAIEGDAQHEDHSDVPDSRDSHELHLFEPRYGDSDPDFSRAVHDFIEDWLTDKEYGRAVNYFDRESFACSPLYYEEHTPNETQTLRALRESLQILAEKLVLDEDEKPRLEPVDPAHEHVHLTRHARSEHFSLFSVPDHLAAATKCETMLDRGGYHPESAEEPVHGQYRGSGMYMQLDNGAEMVLHLLWERKTGGWKIISYHVETQ